MNQADASLRRGWGDFLSRYEWQLFCTFTFRDPTHPERADKLFRVFVSKLNRYLFGPRWHKKPEGGVFWIRGLEWQKRDVIHYHALIGCHCKNLNIQISKRLWSDVWNELAGFARIEDIRCHDDVNAYVTKYSTKGGEIDFSPNLSSTAGITREFDLVRSI